LQTLNIINE